MDTLKTNPNPCGKRVIIVDWGTTSLRCMLVDETGAILSKTESQDGIQLIKEQRFEEELMLVIQPWLKTNGPLSVIALGMITSKNGWVEVPYVACPASPRDLADGVIAKKLPNGSNLYFLPGITDKTRNPFPDVMRGEETQIVGYGLSKSTVVVLPGTHSKWATIKSGTIYQFQTFVTGEIYALLSQHSFIAKAAGKNLENANWDAFERGVQIAESATGPDASFLTLVFSARTGMLANQLGPDEMRDFVSGVLIGSEFRQSRDAGWFKTGDTVGIVGNDGLNVRYGKAANVFDLKIADGGENTAVSGALEILKYWQEVENAIE